MRNLGIALALCGATAGTFVACLKKPTFQCATADECGVGGLCEPDGFCSFADGACTNGRRYGDHSGPNAGQCVGEIGPTPDGPPADMEPDGPPPDARECFGDGAYEICIDGAPMGEVDLAGAFDTTSDVRCLAAQPPPWATTQQPASCFIVGSKITVSGALDVTGSRPLVLVSQEIRIDALLDASSARTGELGPAANSAACTAAVSDAFDGNPGGGGAGGSFRVKGADGGRADNSNGKPGGVAANADATAPALLRGGCPGQVGGDDTGLGGTGGAGGGAVYLAAGSIVFGAGGRINASGAGGQGGGANAGGGGGGAGGMIVLIADTISAAGANLLANGGGGGSGNQGAGASDPGDDPNPATATSPAAGGSGDGGDGGTGFAGASQATIGGSGNNDGGGGGGGGGGYIQSNVAITGASVSPSATIVP